MGFDQDHFESSESAKAVGRAALRPRAALTVSPAWDKFVLVMRSVLPVSAIILGTVTITWPFINDTEVSFNLSRDEVAPSDGKVRMTDLKYVGTDAVDRLFIVEAKSGVQDTPDTPRIRLEGIQAEMELEPGMKARVSARSGIYRMQENSLSLVGGVKIQSDNGFDLTIAGAEIDLKAHTAVGQGTVEGSSPIGTLKAGGMEIRIDDNEGLFTEGVKLHIVPKRPLPTID